jgi:hypothetical protein
VGWDTGLVSSRTGGQNAYQETVRELASRGNLRLLWLLGATRSPKAPGWSRRC